MAFTNITRRAQLGQQCFDVSKYTMTAIVISQVLSKEQWNWLLLVFGGVIVTVFGILGYFAIPQDREG